MTDIKPAIGDKTVRFSKKLITCDFLLNTLYFIGYLIIHFLVFEVFKLTEIPSWYILVFLAVVLMVIADTISGIFTVRYKYVIYNKDMLTIIYKTKLRERVKYIPINNIKFIQINQNVVGIKFDLATITISSGAMQQGLNGLSYQDATNILDDILKYLSYGEENNELPESE